MTTKALPLLLLSACAVDTSGLRVPMSDASTHDDSAACGTFTYVLPDLPEHGQAVVWLDFDRIATPEVQLCMSYVAPNVASGRSLYLGDDPDRLIGFGPCGPWTELRYEQCQTIENTGRTLARLENRPWSAGCQLGAMKDVQIAIRCP